MSVGRRLYQLERKLGVRREPWLDNCTVLTARSLLQLMPDLCHVEPQDTDAQTYHEIEVLRAEAAGDARRVAELTRDEEGGPRVAEPIEGAAERRFAELKRIEDEKRADHPGSKDPWWQAELQKLADGDAQKPGLEEMEDAIDAACFRKRIPRTISRDCRWA